ncbi:MAG: PDZ domain-containing protein [Planctomycetota bacterium]
MKSTSLALLTLMVGLAAGTGVGLVLGGGSSSEAQAADRTVDRQTTVRREVPRTSAEEGRDAGGLAAVNPTVLPASIQTGGSGGASAAARSASAQALGRVEATIQNEGFDGSWTGTITGTVLDANGIALEGATVVAYNGENRYASQARGSDTSKVGRAFSGPADVDEELAERAESLLKTRKRMRTATTDASGRFELTGLRVGRQSIRAYAEGIVFDSTTVQTGDSTQFVGRPVGVYRLDLRLPDGSAPETATIAIGDSRRSTTYRWTREEPEIRLKEPMATIRALAGEVEAVEWREIVSDYASKEVAIDLAKDGEGPHLIELEARRILRVTVDDESGIEPRMKAWVRVVEKARTEGRSPESAFEDAQSLKRGDAGAYTIADLAPGAYVVAAGRGDGVPEVTEEIEIGEGIASTHLVLGELDLGRFLVARCKGPAGQPLTGVRFRRRVESEQGSSSGGADAVERGPGEYWIPLGELLDGKDWKDVKEVQLTGEARSFGKLALVITQGQTSVDFDFQASCELTVRVEGDLSPGFSVTANRMKEGQDVNEALNRWSSEDKRVDAEGNARITGLQPGLYLVSLRKKSGRNRGWSTPVTWEQVTVRAGENEATFVAPTFHDLVIYAPDLDKGTNFWLQRSEPGTASSQYFGGNNTALDEDHKAYFKDVAAGEYIVQSWDGSQQTMKITVPSGEIQWEPDLINAFAVQSVEADKLGAAAGLQVGDVVVAVNGKEFEGNDFYQRLMLGLKDGAVTLSLYRGSRAVDVSLGPAEKPENAWQEVGVNWTPTSQ